MIALCASYGFHMDDRVPTPGLGRAPTRWYFLRQPQPVQSRYVLVDIPMLRLFTTEH